MLPQSKPAQVNLLFYFVDHVKPHRGSDSKILKPSLPEIDHTNHTLNFLHPLPMIGLLIILGLEYLESTLSVSKWSFSGPVPHS